jgi:hypothetical protein
MLEKNSLFFSRANKQTDKLEGEYPREMYAELARRFGNGFPTDSGRTYTFREWHNEKEIPSRLISCWAVSTRESPRMWKEYTQSQESVAICTTLQKLKNCFHDRVEPVVFIGKVRYGQYENRLPMSLSKWDGNFWLYAFFAKRDKFRWENEVRAIVNIATNKQSEFGGTPNGCFIKADLHQLLSSVWINPRASLKFTVQVMELLASYGFGKIQVCNSNALKTEQ